MWIICALMVIAAVAVGIWLLVVVVEFLWILFLWVLGFLAICLVVGIGLAIIKAIAETVSSGLRQS